MCADREAAGAAGGAPVDPVRLRYWEVFGNLRWALICLWQAERHLSGRSRSLELAAVGRRLDEPVYDMLRLLEGEDE